MIIEKQILKGLLVSEDNIKLCKDANIDSSYFQHLTSKRLFTIIMWYCEKYRQSPLLKGDSLEAAFRVSQQMTSEEKTQVGSLFQEVNLLDTPSNFFILLDELKTYHKTNEVARLLEKATTPLHNKDPNKSIEIIKSSLLQLEKTFSQNHEDSGFFGGNAEQKINTYLDQEQHPEKYVGVSLGFREIDRKTKGLKKDTLNIIIGSEKSAKSVLLINIAHNVVSQGKRVFYHVNEGGKELVEQRYASCALGLTLDQIQESQLSSENKQRYFDFLKEYQAKNLLFIDSIDAQHSTVAHVEQKLLDILANGPIDLAIIDYLSVMQPTIKSAVSRELWGLIGQVSLELKGLAQRLKIPILTVMHVNADALKQKDEETFEVHHAALSRQPSKHCDLLLSWKIPDQKAFEVANIGDGVLAVKAARNSKYAQTILRVNTNIMKIEEHVLSLIL